MVDSPPMIPVGLTEEVADHVFVMPDQRVEFVPNAGIVVGERAVLVIDTALGPRNGQRILDEARRLGGERKMLLTTTHFHPEHAFGSQVFGDATYICNAGQTEEMAAKGPEYIEMFSGFGPGLAELLAEVTLVTPDVSFSGSRAEIDLGGVMAELHVIGPAHTRGDQVVFLPESGVLFAGDLVEDRFLPIFPDPDANGLLWLAALDRLEALGPRLVVGGHGQVGDTGLIDALRSYLVAVRDRVNELSARGLALEQIEEQLEPELAELQSGWDNQMWIKSAIDSFHAAAAH